MDTGRLLSEARIFAQADGSEPGDLLQYLIDSYVEASEWYRRARGGGYALDDQTVAYLKVAVGCYSAAILEEIAWAKKMMFSDDYASYGYDAEVVQWVKEELEKLDADS